MTTPSPTPSRQLTTPTSSATTALPTATVTATNVIGTAPTGASVTGTSTVAAALTPAVTATPQVGPTLHLPELADGSSLALPAEVRYTVVDATVPDDVQAIMVTVEGVTDGPSYELPITSAEGVITLPNDTMLSGIRTLRFQLVGATGSALTNLAAQVTVRDIVLSGLR
jgi:hypothetical protein